MGKHPDKKLKFRFDRGRDVLAVVLILLVVWQLGAVALRYVAYLRLDMTEVVIEDFTPQLDTQLIALRNETMVTAPVSGSFTPSLAEGERVSAYGLLGYMENSSGREQVYAPRSGIVSYQQDGWEDKLSAENIEASDFSTLITAWQEGAVTAMTEDVQQLDSMAAGRYVAKIIDNLVDYNVLLYAQLPIEPYMVEDKLSFNYTVEESDITARIKIRVTETDSLSGGYYYALGTVASTEDVLLDTRGLTGQLIGSKISGPVIPASAITTDEKGRTGVYAASLKRLEFVPVEVSGIYGEQVMVSGLKEGDRVVANPERAKINQRIYK